MPSKVLVIDDDELLRPILAEAFSREGFEAVAAEDGVKGMRLYASEHPALVVTDIVMPDKEGIGVILELKGRPSPPKVIAISGGGGIGSDKVLNWARHLGADEVMAKPFALTALIETARRLLAQ